MTFYKERLDIFTFSFISWPHTRLTPQLKNLAATKFKYTSNNNSNDIECIECKLQFNE